MVAWLMPPGERASGHGAGMAGRDDGECAVEQIHQRPLEKPATVRRGASELPSAEASISRSSARISASD
jgi:hypothetical protein